VLVGLVALAIGVIGAHPTLLGVGVVLAGLGGLEVSVREHFAGYRSHTTLLAGTVFVLVTGGLFYLAGLILASSWGWERLLSLPLSSSCAELSSGRQAVSPIASVAPSA